MWPAAEIGRDGYVVLPGWLSAAGVDAVRPVVDESVAEGRDDSCARPNNSLVPLRWCDPLVAALLGDEHRIARLGEAVGARDLRWISGYLSIKEPHSRPLGWHQDWWCWEHPLTYRPAAAQVALLCYLNYTDARGGALRVLPGSHAASTPLHAVLPQADSAAAMRDQPGQVTLPLPAGDAVVIDYRLLHGTHANMGEHRRDCVLLSFTPSWRDLPADVRAHLINHPALPMGGEQVPSGGWTARLLPHFDGPRRDLQLDRDAPAAFAIDC